MRRRTLAVVVFAVLAAAVAAATPIVYTFQATGTGTLGATNFSNASFVINVQADTNNITLGGPGTYLNPDISSTIAITGVGTVTFTQGKDVFCNQTLAVAGFSGSDDAADQPGDLLNVDGAAFAAYALDTSLGPIFDAAIGPVAQFTNIQTSGGLLTFTSYQDATFTATLGAAEGVPTLAPFGVALMALLLLAAGVFIARRL